MTRFRYPDVMASPETTSEPGPSRPYHHGDLRRALLDAAVASLAETGAAGLNLRALARRAGVSHAAPAHHFGDKTGLLTAVATEGYELLAAALAGAWARTGDFREVGVAYVRFAVEHPGHFEVMFSPEVLDGDDPALRAASEASGRLLYGPMAGLADEVGAEADGQPTSCAPPWPPGPWPTGWPPCGATGPCPPALGDDIEAEARAILGYLFSPLGGPTGSWPAAGPALAD